MTTLIAAYKSDGRCIGRCDANCYNAHDTRCTCICGGANHGIGFHNALQNTRDRAQTHSQALLPQKPFSLRYTLNPQLDLWPDEPNL